LRAATVRRGALNGTCPRLPPGGPAEIDLVGAGQSTRRCPAGAANDRTSERVASERAADSTSARADRTAAEGTIFRRRAASGERQRGKGHSDT